jgi:hypothetical protein
MDASLFNFNNHQEAVYIITPTIHLHIKRISNGIAELYFTDETGFKMEIPNDIEIYSYDPQNNTKRYIIIPLKQNNYALAWTENYDIDYNNKTVLTLKNQRNWIISKEN